jgi:Rps23 Pro-64 3,4-dihydroxylase Tpa1-like proline 4-hydroxylase
MSIAVIENVLRNHILESAIKIGIEAKGVSTQNNWDDYLASKSDTIELVPLTGDIRSEITKDIESLLDIKIDDSRLGVVFTKMTSGGFLPWHPDHVYEFALTVYATLDWIPEHMGYFMYKDNDDIKVVEPLYNRGVLVTNATEHCVVPVSDKADCRYSIQIFYKE